MRQQSETPELRSISTREVVDDILIQWHGMTRAFLFLSVNPAPGHGQSECLDLSFEIHNLGRFFFFFRIATDP